MTDDEPKDPWAGFPGGDPFGGGNPFGAGFSGDPFKEMDEFMRRMGIDPKEFRSLFDDMQRNLQEAFKNMGDDPTKGFVQGFNVRMGPDGKPHFSSFGNKPHVDTEEGGVPQFRADEREPLTDVIEEDGAIAITMELPGVQKEDIEVRMTEEQLEIGVDTEARKYHKRVKLPAKVDPSTTKATYNNGVLDVTVQKVETQGDGVRIQVD